MQRKSILNRSKRSDDLELPRNFEVGQAKAEGDCFFDSFRQGLKQIGIEVTVDELRRECAEFARNNPPGWFISAVVNKSMDVDNVDKYVERIARDEWGDSDIEGRILCQKYNVRLHVAEKQREGVWVHSIVDGEGLRSAGNIDYDQDNLIHIANRGHDHFEPILRRQEVQHGQQPIVQPPENQLPSEREHQTQDFELVQLLFKKGRTGAETPPRSNFETFEERFQSFIDQMPSYLHSVEKEGFFTNLLFGMFSILLDTKIAGKLGVKEIYFHFYTAKISKVVAVKSYQINNAEDAINNIKLFSISELYGDEEGESESKFTSGYLEGILKKFKTPAEARRIKDEVKDRMEFESVRIRKRQGHISVERRDEKMSDSPAHEEFHKIEKGLWSNPEDDIAGLADSNTIELIQEYVGEVFEKIHYVYSKYKGLLKHGISEGGKHFREAAHHGFITGILMDFRYGYNVRINIEQLAGRGYADIILLVLGPNRKMNRVPVIVELKAARYEDVEKLKKLLEKREALTKEEEREKSAIEQRIEKSLDDGLMQALNYAKGFDLDAMPFLTFSNEVFVMSLNLDSEQAFKMNSHQLVKVIDRSTIMRLLDRVSGWDGQEDTRNKLEDEIKVALERVYYTFPSVGERQDGSLSRFLLGELILANRFGEYSLERSIFLYGEHPLEGRRESNEGRPVTTFVLTNKGENEVLIFHIREGGRGDPSSKKVPINSPKHSKITEVHISLDGKKKSDFFSIDKIARYESLSDYKEGREPFQGELKDIPYPEGLREAFNGALDLELRKFSTDKFSQLFSKIGEAIFPVRSLVGIEANFRQVLNGAFRTYGSLLRQAKDSKIIVLAFTEVQYGEGKRVDIVVRTSGIDGSGKVVQSTIVSLELKGPREGASVETLIKEANNQINRKVGKFVRSKAIIEDGEIKEVGVVWNNQAVDGRSLIAMSSENFIISDVVHSSIRRPPHRAMDISPDRTSSQQFRNDFPHTSLSEGIVRISDPQRLHSENSFPGLSIDVHRGSSSSSGQSESEPPSKKAKLCIPKRLRKREVVGSGCLLDMDENKKVDKEKTGIEINKENFDESKIDNEKLRAYQEKIKDEGNEINDQLNKLIIEIQQAQAIKRFSDTYKVIIKELFPALENIDGMQSENRSYFEQMCKLNLLRIISPIIKDVDFKSLLFNNSEKLVKDQSLLENVFASVENLISDKYKQQQLQYEDFENLENQINEEILNKSEETEGIANQDVNKTDLLNYVFESIGLSLLMSQDTEVSDLQKRIYYETLINLGVLIHDHKNHIQITHNGDQHTPHINSLVERVKSSKLLSIAHDLYYLRKNEGNIDQSNLCSSEVKSKISLYGSINSEYKLNDIHNKFNIDEIKSYFSEDELKKVGAEFEAYDKEVITIHSPQVFTSGNEVHVKVRDNNKQLIIGSIEDIKNIENYSYNEETLEIKLKVRNDKEYTITHEEEKREAKYYLNIAGYKTKVGNIINSFTDQAKNNIHHKLKQLQDKIELLAIKKGIEVMADIEVSGQDYIREVRQNLLMQGVSESTFDQFEKQLDYVNEEVFRKYVSDISEELTKNNIEFNNSKFNVAKMKGAKGNKFFSIMAIYDLLDSVKDVPTLGRHDNNALKRIFGINGILDAMNDVRESLGASYIRPNGKVVTKIRPDSAIGKAFRKIPQSARKAFVKLINNPVVESITFATVAYQFGYSIDAIVKGDHHPLNYYFATSNGIKLASMSMKPISIGVGAAVKGLSATSKALRVVSGVSKVLGKLSVATAVVDFVVTVGITIHEAVEYVKAIGSKIPLSDVEQTELFLDRILREFSPLYLLIKAIENGKTLEESYKDAIKIKDFLGFILAEGKEILSYSSVVTTVQCLTSVKAGDYNVAAALRYLRERDNYSLNAYLTSIKNHCSAASVSQCLASKRDNDGLSAVVRYVTSIREEYSEIIKSDCSDRSPRGCNRVCTTESKYTGSSLGEINSNGENLFSLDISKVLPLVSSTLGGREVYFIDKDIKYLPHVTLDEYNDGLRVVMVPSSFREGSLTCGDIINEGVKSSGSSKECNDGKVYRNCTKAFTSSGEPFIFANIERSNSSPILYLSGPRQLIAAANYPAVMHIPKGRVNYKGSEYHDNTFIINYDTYGRIRGGTANNTIVMNYSPSSIFVRLDNGIIYVAGSKIELANIHNYISHSTANQNITTGCKTRYVDAGKGGGNNSIQNYDVYCQDEDYEIRKVNKKDIHLRSIKQTIFIVDKSSGSGANISSGNLKLKENLDVISVENADVAQLRISEHQNGYRLDFVACDEKDEVISVKVDSFEKLVIQTKKAEITKIIKIENKSLLDIIKDMAYQKLSHAGTDIDRKIVENSEKRSKAVIIADITDSEDTTAYAVAKDIAESSDNLGITVSQIQVIKGDIVLNYAVNDLSQIKLIPNNGISDEEQREYNRLLFQAVERKNLDEIRRLLVMGADVEVKGDHNLTPLSIAVRKNGGEVIDLLLDMGANINAKGAYNWTSAKWAVFDNRENLVIQLVNRGTDIGYKDNMGHTLLDTARRFGRRRIGDFLRKKQSEYDRDLLTAASNGDIDKVRDLLNRGANIEAVNGDKSTPLHCAAWHSRLNVAKLLFGRGAKIEAKDINNSTPLLYAIQDNKSVDLVEFLVNKGANIGVKNDLDQTPLGEAKKLHNPEIANFLREKQSEYDRDLLTAVRNRDINKVRDLLDRGANIEAQNNRGWTPLCLASQKGSLDIATLLLDRGANIEAKGKNGWNVLHEAIYYNKPDMFKFLVKRGARINVKNGENETPLEAARRLGRPEIEGFLIAKQSEGRVRRKRRHHHARHHSSRKLLATDLSNQPEIAARQDVPENSLQNDETGYNKGGATSGASKPSSWINVFANTIVGAVKGASQFISSPFKPAIDMEPSKAATTQGTDVNGTLFLLDVFIRKITGQKYVSTADQPTISLPEAVFYASDIINGFEKAVEQAASKSGMSMHRLVDIDSMEMREEITGKIMGGKFNEIPGVLISYAEKACPGKEAGCPGKLSPKKFDKFMTIFNNRINITLDESILRILHSEHNKSKVKNIEEQQRNLKDKKQPRSYLDDSSVQGLLTQAVVSK